MERELPNSRINSAKNYLFLDKTPKIIRQAITVSVMIAFLFIIISLVNLFTFEASHALLTKQIKFVDAMGKANLEMMHTVFSTLMSHYLAVAPGNETVKHSNIIPADITRLDYFTSKLH
jgi:hypothetical protein